MAGTTSVPFRPIARHAHYYISMLTLTGYGYKPNSTPSGDSQNPPYGLAESKSVALPLPVQMSLVTLLYSDCSRSLLFPVNARTTTDRLDSQPTAASLKTLD